ncbi:Type II secretion system protein D [Massilia sp. Bi118]|uniref:type II and III secretion system protein family protein n=1 Tax=Massilia sp. Bi118 TaxID=2822346 RepID=UPI001DB32583|nr:type II and III secretion system protein family protein [Massilia sp. Bi118]CAH0216064.1 Type II secretion system protein D [Massilia sp. Bi118]
MHTPIVRILFAGLVLAASGPALAAAKTAAQANDNPTAMRSEPGPRCQGEAARPAQLTLNVGKSQLMRLPEAVQHRSVGNPGVVQAILVAPDTLYIAGVDIGTTNMIVQGKSGVCNMLDITVAMDPSAVRATLEAALPEERDIKVLAAADTLILSGAVSDAGVVERAVELANAYVRRPLRPLAMPDKDEAAPGTVGGANGAAGGAASSTSQSGASNARVINLLTVHAPQQVQLEVKVAEVSKSLLERLEAGAAWRFGSGSWGAQLLSNFLTGSAHGALQGAKVTGNSVKGVSINAEKEDSLVRVLAEPNVMAISGQEGTFLAGGKFYVPVAQDNNRVTLEEKEFGVGIRFTPTVLGGGRINLRVAPEVSELSREGIGISATGLNGAAILPVVTTRRASTTVQLYDGQSFVIGGLIKNNLVANLKGLPVLGEVPVLGALFRSTDYQHDRTELVFVITAHLVKPLQGPGYELPTDKVGIPSRGAMMLGGRLDAPAPEVSTAAASAPAPGQRPSQSAGGFELK